MEPFSVDQFCRWMEGHLAVLDAQAREMQLEDARRLRGVAAPHVYRAWWSAHEEYRPLPPDENARAVAWGDLYYACSRCLTAYGVQPLTPRA